jgi:hypothetical protein
MSNYPYGVGLAPGGIDATDGIDYTRLKRLYEADDYIEIAFTLVEDYYVVGLMAYLLDTNVPDLFTGWSLFRHEQPGSPAFLAALVGPTLPVEVPSFESKTMMFLCDQDCYIRFEGASRVQHYIPKNTFMTFNRRCNMFFVMGLIAGTLKVWMLG